MNKRANIYLNIFGVISFILTIILITLSLRLETLSYHTPYILRMLVTLLGFICGIIFISIESFLFILMKNRYRLIEIGYVLIEIVLAVLISAKIPFAFFIVLPILNVGRNLLRISLVDKLYIPKEFNRYCKMFGIKIKDFPKKRTTTRKKTIDIPVDDTVYNKKTKTSKKHAEAVSI